MPVSPTQQAVSRRRIFGRPTVQSQSATPGLVNGSTTGSADSRGAVGQTVIDGATCHLAGGPLRLGAPQVDSSILDCTLTGIFSLPEIIRLDSTHKQTLARFVLSLFAPANWWHLRNIICKVVASSGFRNTERSGLDQPQAKPRSEKPQCVQDYIASWQQNRGACQNSAHPDVTKILKMNNEMQLYVYWCCLQRVWLKTRHDYNPDRAHDEPDESNSECLGGEDARISADQEAELVDFFDHEVKRREKSLGHEMRTRSVAVLKSLMAPYLGYSFPLGTEATARRAPATDNMFNTLWSRTNVRGKRNYILTRNLGWGAFAIAKSSHLVNLGSNILSQILPIVRDNHPYLREIFATVYDIFIYPITWGSLLLYQDIGSFIHIKSKEELIQVCKEHPNGLNGIFQSGGRRISASVQEELGSPAADPVPATTSMDDTGLLEQEENFDVKELLEQEHAIDLVEDEHMTLPRSEGRKRRAVVEAAGSVARGMKRRGTD
ncbi:MAG: hypothetical protein Q9210_007421 [Variospora velana]